MTALRSMVAMTAVLLGILTITPHPCIAQVVGDEAELGRLQTKAEDAIGNDDPDGAAMMMGRAALLAMQLAKKQTGWSAGFQKGQEALFRSQEHTYRAIALFRRAGGQLPASSGVCGSLALAHTSLGHAANVETPPSVPRLIDQATHLRAATDNWRQVIDSLTSEYHCP